MSPATPLPDFLVQRYQAWKDASGPEKAALLRRLADDGQSPATMVISCSDSRVNVTEILGQQEGELFVVRNVANLVPPCEEGVSNHGTEAAVEFAVNALKVSHLVVLGHSGCGGIKGCYEMCSGRAPALEDPQSYLGRWIAPLREAHARLTDGSEADRLTQMEKVGVMVSLENLAAYPFVAAAMAEGRVQLHGLWIDVGTGAVSALDPETGEFHPI